MTSQRRQSASAVSGAAAVWLLLAVAAPRFSDAQTLRLRSEARQPGAAGVADAAAERLALPEQAGDAWIVQHVGTIDAGWRQAVEQTGARIVGYLPDNAYLVRIDPSRRPLLAGLAAALAVRPYRPLDRLAPALLAELGGERDDELASPEGTEPRPPSVAVRVAGFRGEDGEAILRRALASAPGIVTLAVSRSEAGRATLVLEVPRRGLASLVRALATDPAVEFVAREARAHAMNGDAAWLLQSGVSGSRPLFSAAGLTGVGQTVAIADMGLDAAACQFNFVPGPGTPSNTTQPPQANVTNPADKVTTYYLATGADDGDAAVTGFHGSGVAGAMAGDNGKAPALIAPRTNPYTLATPDAGDGLAPGAQLVVQDIGTSDGAFVLGLNQDNLLTQAYRSGARVHNSSYGLLPIDTGSGLQTLYDSSVADLDDALWRLRDLSSVWAAGNWGAVDPATQAPWNGQRSLSGLGAVAKNTISVGASGNPGAAGESAERLAAESARGPSLEGLWKPDLVAPGHNLTTTDDATPASCAVARRTTLGTSFAAGAISGMAALARQYFTDGYHTGGARTRIDVATEPERLDPSNALVKAALVNSGRSLTGSNTGDLSSDPCPGAGCSAPSFGQGWGRVQLDDALFFTGDARSTLFLADIWNGSSAGENSGRGAALTPPLGVPRGALTTHETHNFAFELRSASNAPLRCTLAWSDPAAAPAAAVALVNDLDLEVHDPGPDRAVGTGDDLWYHGNQFLDSAPYSDATRSGWDAQNPVENLWIQNPSAGVYNVRVYGRNVPGNGLRDVVAEPLTLVPGPVRINSWQQGYALLCSGDPADVRSIPVITASAVPDPAVGCVEDAFQVSFDATCSSCVAWSWDFGDGGSDTVKSPMHVYASAGLYLVTVTGRDANGVEGRISFPIEAIIGNKLPAGTVANTLQMVKQPPAFTALIANWSDIGVPAATTYQLWEFAAKAQVSSHPPTGTRIVANPEPLLHGSTGAGFTPPATGLTLYQIRAANCLGEPGP